MIYYVITFMNKHKLKRKHNSKPLAFIDVRGVFVSELKSFKKLLFVCFLTLGLLSLHSASFANSVPTLGSIALSVGQSAPDAAVTFTAIYTDADGWQNLKEAYLLINASLNTRNCCYLYYNQNTNKLYIRNDADTSWIGGYAPGSSYVIENSYARLDCSKTTVTGSAATVKVLLFFKGTIPEPVMTIKWNVTFKKAFSDTKVKKTFLYVRDDLNGSCGWIQNGIWIVTAPTPPAAIVPEITLTDPIENTIINAEP